MQQRTDIDNFIETMKLMLPTDLQQLILREYIYKERNLQIIKKQKETKVTLNKELLYMFNVFYDDNNLKLYKNQNNQYVLRNYLKNKQFYICTANNEIIPVNNTNELVLFEPQYDMNGHPIQRRIKLNIVYI
jgi:hypothetical protein